MIHLDARLINDYHSLQWRDAKEFLQTCKEVLKWGDLSGETIMDVGCGPGNNSTKLLLAEYPNVGKIIATDGSEDMIRLALESNPHPKVEYHVADIQDESVHRKWFGVPSKVVAIHCFHWAKEQVKAFQNVYNLLKPGGEAVLLFVLNAPNFDVCRDLKESPKWQKMTKDASCGIPESHTKRFRASYYSRIASDIGFTVVLCKGERITFPFASDEIFKGFLSSVCPLVKHIPEKLRGEFEEELLKGTLEHCERSPNGLPNFHCTYISVLLRKPS